MDIELTLELAIDHDSTFYIIFLTRYTGLQRTTNKTFFFYVKTLCFTHYISVLQVMSQWEAQCIMGPKRELMQTREKGCLTRKIHPYIPGDKITKIYSPVP